MMKSRSTRFGLLLALPLLVTVDGLLPKTVRGEIRTATALTPEAVRVAIKAAKDGDIVQLPAGMAVWKKGWNAGHWAKMKAITIQGAGIDKTIIRTDTTTAPGDKSFVINGVEGKPFRITGITFVGTGFPNAGTWAGEVVISGNCKNFRIDHCKFLNMDQMMSITGDTYGLIDHCYFHALVKNRQAQTIMCQGPGKIAFTRPLTLGTAQAVYFEDNEARFSPEVVNPNGNNPWIVPYNGARVVIRHNKIINSQLEIYRVRPGAYGCQSAEIYDNEFSTKGLKMYRPQGFIFIAGGAAMVFNNTVTGTTYNCRTIELSHDRSFRAFGEFGVRHAFHRWQSDPCGPERGRLVKPTIGRLRTRTNSAASTVRIPFFVTTCRRHNHSIIWLRWPKPVCPSSTSAAASILGSKPKRGLPNSDTRSSADGSPS